MSRFTRRGRRLLPWLSYGTLLALGGCLTDQQTTTILTGVITSGLSALLNVFISGLAGGTATG